MQSRMDKYYNNRSTDNLKNDDYDELENTTTLRRLDKNQTLYKEVSKKELEDFDLNSNVSIIGEGNNVDIDKIREMLDRKYRELPKNKTIGTSEADIGKINLAETREYDLNSILEKAHKEKEVNYEEDRLKKLRNTQYDILKSLDILKKDKIVDEDEDKIETAKSKEEKKLQELIDTITAKELISKKELEKIENDSETDLDPLDLLSDLRGDDENTKVLGALTEEQIADEELLKKEPTRGIEKPKVNDQPLEIKPIEIDDSFVGKSEKNNTELTNTVSFTQSDFDDFNDLKEDMHFTKIVVRILIILLVVIFLVGCLILVNKIFGLGLF